MTSGERAFIFTPSPRARESCEKIDLEPIPYGPLTLSLSPDTGGEGKKKSELTPSSPFGGEGWRLDKLPQGRVRGTIETTGTRDGIRRIVNG